MFTQGEIGIRLFINLVKVTCMTSHLAEIKILGFEVNYCYTSSSADNRFSGVMVNQMLLFRFFHSFYFFSSVICDDSWTVDGGKCYKLVHDRANAENALAECENMGSTLATDITEEKNEFIKTLILES